MSEHFPAPVSEFDEFLFATLCTESNGMQLSVVSAVARIDVDPWERSRSPFDHVQADPPDGAYLDPHRATGKDWSAGEEAAIAARLLELRRSSWRPCPFSA